MSTDFVISVKRYEFKHVEARLFFYLRVKQEL